MTFCDNLLKSFSENLKQLTTVIEMNDSNNSIIFVFS